MNMGGLHVVHHYENTLSRIRAIIFNFNFLFDLDYQNANFILL